MNDTDKLLHKAHLIINDATGTDIPQDVLDKAKEKARRIYNQIKTINHCRRPSRSALRLNR